QNPWCVWVGAKYGAERVKYLALGDIWLNPGMTGLVVLDAFALGLPMATTDNGIHSPEICYVRQGENGILTHRNPGDYAEQVADLLQTQPALASMQENALNESFKYSAEDMASRFAQGILRCLSGEIGEGITQ
ncbi:MAG: glycosyltransferase, partial [Lentisphaerae bacterium]|nr:glycosyltransferase [Lentisphaerota bacterium]